MYGNDPVRVPLPGRHVERGLVIQGGTTGRDSEESSISSGTRSVLVTTLDENEG